MWPPSERRLAAITEAARAPIDWDRFLRVSARHRVIGLAHEGLKAAQISVPPPIQRALAAAALRQTHLNLLFAAEIVRLKRAFDREGLPVIVFKGVPTALEIYGNIGIRESKDIDLLVAPTSMARAEALLRAEGYARFDPPESLAAARVRTLMSIGKDFVYVSRANSSLEVELHWRLFNNAVFMSNLRANDRVFPELDGVSLRTLEGDDHFAYLCAHGAAFAWCRLKWLADIAAVLAKTSSEETARLYRAAVVRGAGRSAAQALLLCERLLGSALPDGLAGELRKDRVVRELETLALTAMLQGNAEIDPHDLPNGLKPVSRSLWLLRGDFSYLRNELAYRWTSRDDIVLIPLPEGLQFLYLLLRVPLWLGRRARATWSRARRPQIS
jgi:hypothetical protein